MTAFTYSWGSIDEGVEGDELVRRLNRKMKQLESSLVTFEGAIEITAAQVVSGTLADARLSSNVPRLDAENTWTNTGTQSWVGFHLITRSVASTNALAVLVTGDSQRRFELEASGALEWGSGSATPDVRLERGGADQLKLSDQFYITRASASDHLRLERTGTAADVVDFLFASTGLFITWSGASSTARFNLNGANNTLDMPSAVSLRWCSTDVVQGGTFDVNLYRGGANRLETDDQFAADSIRVTGTGTQMYLDATADTPAGTPQEWVKIDVNGVARYLQAYS